MQTIMTANCMQSIIISAISKSDVLGSVVMIFDCRITAQGWPFLARIHVHLGYVGVGQLAYRVVT